MCAQKETNKHAYFNSKTRLKITIKLKTSKCN